MIDVQRLVPGRVRWWRDRAAEWARSLPDAARARQLASSYRIDGRYRRIYFWHIRKTGGISLSSAMLGVACDDGAEGLRELARQHGRLVLDDKVFVAWNVYLIEQGHYFYAFSHMRRACPRSATISRRFSSMKKWLLSTNVLLASWDQNRRNRQVNCGSNALRFSVLGLRRLKACP